MKVILFGLILFLATSLTYAQNVSIGLLTNDVSWNTVTDTKVRTLYEAQFGLGNVTVVDYSTNYTTSLATLNQHDIIILNIFLESSLPQSLADDVVSLYNSGKHLVISTEGSSINNNDKFASHVWNRITGQSITETDANASGTLTPPRFHPSAGPGGLSENQALGGSSSTYASFGNLNPLNVLHQRTQSIPVCSNVEGVDALYPQAPSTSTGTIYINGEIYYPFVNPLNDLATYDLAQNIIILHKALITNDQTKLNELNSWVNDANKQVSFKLKKEDINYVLPNVFSPNNDGINDLFKAAVKSHPIAALNFKVINRWGSEVYHTNDIDINWDGTNLSSNSLTEGVYYYILEATFKSDCGMDDTQYTLSFKGNVDIVKQ